MMNFLSSYCYHHDDDFLFGVIYSPELGFDVVITISLISSSSFSQGKKKD